VATGGATKTAGNTGATTTAPKGGSGIISSASEPGSAGILHSVGVATIMSVVVGTLLVTIIGM
jgi:hypothetical protein